MTCLSHYVLKQTWLAVNLDNRKNFRKSVAYKYRTTKYISHSHRQAVFSNENKLDSNFYDCIPFAMQYQELAWKWINICVECVMKGPRNANKLKTHLGRVTFQGKHNIFFYENIMKNWMAIDHGNAMLTKTAYISLKIQ